MKIPVIFIAAAVAVSASRPPRGYSTEYRDTPPFFDTPPHPPPPRPSFLRNYKRQETYYRHPQSFGDDVTFFSDGPPSSYREGRIYFDSPPPPSSYFPTRDSHSYYHHAPTNFKINQLFTDEYKGPPPPAPKGAPQLEKKPTRDEISNVSPVDIQITKAFEEQKIQQTTTTQPRQPLSFGGHSNHFNFGNHALGFASVVGATSPDINPLAIDEIKSTTKAIQTISSTISMHSPESTSSIQVSQQQAATNPTSTEISTSAIPTSTTSPKIASSQETSASTPSDLKSTTPASTTKLTSNIPKANLDSIQNSYNQTPGVSMILHELPRTNYDFRTVTQEYPHIAHGQLPIETSQPQLQIPDVKQNLLLYETKNVFPFHQANYQIQQQQQHQDQQQNGNSYTSAPVRFSIPTAPITATLSTINPTAPVAMKLSFQGAELARTPFTLMTVPNLNSYNSGQNQIDPMQLAKLTSSVVDSAPRSPSFYILPNHAQVNHAPQINSGTPLGSFYLLPNNEQIKQQVQANVQGNSNIPPGLQLQLSGYGGVEFLTSSSNSEPMRMADMGIGKGGLSFIEQFQSQEQPTFTKIGFGQNPFARTYM